MINPTVLTNAQLSNLLGGVRFSTGSTLVVPAIIDGGRSPEAFCAPLAEHPEPFAEFVEMGELADGIEVETRLGNAIWENRTIRWGKEGDESLTLRLENGYENGAPVLGAALVYSNHGFRVSIQQANYLLLEETGLNGRAHGTTTMEISSGARLFREVAAMRKNIQDPLWHKVAKSMRGGDVVTPMTAFYLATIISHEILWGEFSKMEMMIPREEICRDLSKRTGYRGRLALPAGIRLDDFAHRDVLFGSLEKRVNGFSPEKGFFFEPEVVVEYHPAAKDLIPYILVAQRSMFSRRGTGPIAGSIADMMIASAMMRPRLFPLRDFEMN